MQAREEAAQHHPVGPVPVACHNFRLSQVEYLGHQISGAVTSGAAPTAVVKSPALPVGIGGRFCSALGGCFGRESTASVLEKTVTSLQRHPLCHCILSTPRGMSARISCGTASEGGRRCQHPLGSIVPRIEFVASGLISMVHDQRG